MRAALGKAQPQCRGCGGQISMDGRSLKLLAGQGCSEAWSTWATLGTPKQLLTWTAGR